MKVQHAVDGSGPAAPEPAPQSVCPAQFGNTDVFVSKITPYRRSQLKGRPRSRRAAGGVDLCAELSGLAR